MTKLSSWNQNAIINFLILSTGPNLERITHRLPVYTPPPPPRPTRKKKDAKKSSRVFVVIVIIYSTQDSKDSKLLV